MDEPQSFRRNRVGWKQAWGGERMSQADREQMSEEEIATIVALHHGNPPGPDDPVGKALQARGLARRSADATWELTSEGEEYIAQLG
jgi:hypothetical protein